MDLQLTNYVIRNLKIAKVFEDHTDKVTAIDFSPNGEQLISCGENDRIVLYDCENNRQSRIVKCEKYGADLIRFTGASDRVIHSSTKVDAKIRFLNLNTNQYIRYFSGHTNEVVSLCMSPVDDTFLSGSLDNTVRLWDLGSTNCHGLMHVPGRPVATYDPEGLIFAVGEISERIKLYDMRAYLKGPFETFRYEKEDECDWTGLKFSPDGTTLLIITNDSKIHLVDAFNGTHLYTFSDYSNTTRIPIEASFSPDSQFVFSGSTDGSVHVWNTNTGNKECVLNGGHPHPVHCVQFNPQRMLLASAYTNMTFWEPTPDDGL